MTLTVNCSECPAGEKVSASHENERLVCNLPKGWGFVLYEPGDGESHDVTLCSKCNTEAGRRWGIGKRVRVRKK